LPKIAITEGPDQGREYTIDQAVILGRLDSSDIPIHDRKASREHAKVYRQGQRYAIVDLNSSNGTFVNGSRITKVLLESGDEIRIGTVALRFQDPEAEAQREKQAAASGRKSLDEAFAGKPAAKDDSAPVVLKGYQPIQYSRIKRGNPGLGFDLDQLSEGARLLIYLALLVVFTAIMYVGYLVLAG